MDSFARCTQTSIFNRGEVYVPPVFFLVLCFDILDGSTTSPHCRYTVLIYHFHLGLGY